MTVSPTEIKQSTIFHHLNFLVIANSPNEIEESKHIIALIKSNGASSCEAYYTYKMEYQIPRGANLRNWLLKQDFNKKEINIVVSNSSNFQLYNLFEYELLIPVVTTDWVSLCVKSQRHLRTSNFSPNPKLIFKDFQMLVSKHAFNHAEYFLISEIIHCLGGTTVDYITKATTHIVTTTPSDPAITTIEKYRNSRSDFDETMSIQYILPTWPAQCFLESYPVSINDHLIALSSDKQDILEKQNDIWDDIHGFESLYGKKKKKVLSGRGFKISTDIELNPKVYRYFISLIKNLGGVIIPHNNIDEEDGSVVRKVYALMNNDVNDEVIPDNIVGKGNLLWIVNMWNREKYLHPNSNVIFAPIKRKLFKKKDLVVTYTNYFGAQRLYLQRLIEFLGGSATMELSKQNTHLICNIPFGKKYDVAKKWIKNGSDIKICSHRWLEECYESGKKLNIETVRFLNLERKDNSYSCSLGQLNVNKNENIDESEEETDIEDSQVNPFEFIMNSQKQMLQRNNEFSSKKLDLPEQQINSEKNNTSDKPVIISKQKRTDNTSSQNNEDTPSPDFQTRVDHAVEESSTEKSSICNLDTDNCEGRKATFTNDDIYDTAPTVPIDATAILLPTNSSDRATTNDSSQRQKSEPKTTNHVKFRIDQGDCIKTTVKHIEHYDKNKEIAKGQNLSGDEESTNEKTKVSHIEESMNGNSFDVDTAVTDVAAGIGNRKAKAQAAKRLVEDIESLNEHEKNSSKKRKVRDRNGALLLPEEIKQLEKIEKFKAEAKEIVMGNKYIFNEETKQFATPFNINAICTGFATNDINEVDKQLLNLLGVNLLHDDIDKHLFEDQRGYRGKNKINTIISPKKARTVKFLKSFSLTSLNNFLIPQFLFDLIESVKKGKNIENYKEMPSKYRIEGITEEMIEKIKGKRVFDKSFIHEINVSSDLKGGSRVIIDILRCHGVKEASVLAKSYSIEEIKRNKKPPNYVLLASTKAQANKFKKTITDSKASILVVSWDWCVNCIFNSTIDYEDKKNIFYFKTAS